MRAVLVVFLVASLGEAFGDDLCPNLATGLGAELERVCLNVCNSYECAKAIENVQLNRKIPGIYRKGLVLRIQKARGGTVILKDSPDAEDDQGIWYSYLKPMPRVGYHLVHAQLYQGRAYVLIGMNTGVTYPIDAVPIVSPDRRRFVTVASCGGDDPCGIKIWRFLAFGPRLEWDSGPDYREGSSARWLSPRIIRIDRRDSDGNRTGEILVERSQRGWTVAPSNK